MASHWRVLLFCVALLASPALWSLGQWIGGDIVGAAICLVVVVATAVYANAGQPKPPAGIQPGPGAQA